jgi:hypothetical protein
MWNVVLPYSRAGVVGGAMLALGRALGETMAVTFVIGNAHHINGSLFSPGTTISATIANEFTEALGTLYIPALIELGLVLFGSPSSFSRLRNSCSIASIALPGEVRNESSALHQAAYHEQHLPHSFPHGRGDLDSAGSR